MWICTAPCEHTYKALSYQGISQFYLHTPRTSASASVIHININTYEVKQFCSKIQNQDINDVI